MIHFKMPNCRREMVECTLDDKLDGQNICSMKDVDMIHFKMPNWEVRWWNVPVVEFP
jgi:hypothetical protein